MKTETVPVSLLQKLLLFLRKPQLRSAVAVLVMRVSLAGFGFVTAVVLARVLGPSEFGIYSLVIAWISFFTIPAMMGLRPLIVRETARAEKYDDSVGAVGRVYRTALNTTSCAAIFLVIIALAVFWIFHETFGAPFLAFLVATLVLPLLALNQVRQAALQGLRRTGLGLVPEAWVQPILFVGILVLCWVLIGTPENAQQVLYLKSIAIIGGYAAGVWIVRRQPPLNAIDAGSPGGSIPEIRAWLGLAPPFLLIAFSHMLSQRINVIMLGAMTSPESVGIFTVALRAAELTIFPMLAINAIAAPAFAQIRYESVKKQKRTYLKYCFATVIITIFTVVTMLLIGKQLLSLFGEPFIAAYPLLVILCIGQLINSLSGQGIIFLIMLGKEKTSSIVILVTGILSVVLNALLIPHYAETGAAASTVACLVFQSVALLFLIFSKREFN